MLTAQELEEFSLVLKGSSMVRYVLQHLLYMFQIELFLSLGLYSGIFTMHIKKSRTQNRPFLCSLSSLRSIYCYHCRWFNKSHTEVSNSSVCVKIILKKIYQLQFHISKLSLQPQSQCYFTLGIIQITASGRCDFIAQCIIVRMLNHYDYTYHPFIDLNLQKTVVGSRYSFRDHPFILGNRILRSVNIYLHFI